MKHEVALQPTRTPREVSEQICGALEGLKAECMRKLSQWRAARTAEDFEALERALHEMFRNGADEITKALVTDIVEDPEYQEATNNAVRASGQRYRSGGRRSVQITLLGGSSCEVRVPYLRLDLSGRPGRKRGTGRRGKAGAGLYPALAALGIWFGVTPALAQQVCKQVTLSDSVRAGRAGLASQGCDLGHKQTLRVVKHVSHRMLEQRKSWIARSTAEPPSTGPLVGKRVVVAIDGGRLRERACSTKGRRRAETGHRSYKTPWREPKLFVIYEIDEDGQQVGSFRPVYDGTLGDCNEMFNLLLGYLQDLGTAKASSLTFIADGAPWIWERTQWLTEQMGMDDSNVCEIIDWSHAVSTLHTIANYVKNWTEGEKNTWIRRAKDLLHAGQIDELLAHIDTLATGRRAKNIRKHRNYFQNNAARMQYDAFVANCVPTGSGAVESAIRCIINLRLKGCGKFWKEKNAESMILMRSYLKADRFEDLFHWSLAQATPWWPHNTPYVDSPLVARGIPAEASL